MTRTLRFEEKETLKVTVSNLSFQQSCSTRSLASFLGNIVSSFEEAPYCKLYYRNIEQQKNEELKTLRDNFDAKIKQLSLASLSEIKWWYKNT